MSSSSALDRAEAHIRAEAHKRTVACMRDHRSWWWIAAHRVNHSAFNGYHPTPSDYSEIRCAHPDCGRRWRTKAAYADALPGIPPAEQETRP